MPMELDTPPAEEPVALADVKAHLRIDHADEDDYLNALIVGARMRLESESDQAFVTQTWIAYLDRWPATGEYRIPLGPVSSITEVTVRDAAGTQTAVSPSLYALDAASEPARLVLTGALPSPAAIPNGIAVTFQVGFGAAADVPGDLKHALLMVIAHWYEHRDPMIGAETAHAVPKAAHQIMQSYRVMGL
ncbi:MAG: head-tail connector protein [Pseudomonadota bacterium]